MNPNIDYETKYTLYGLCKALGLNPQVAYAAVKRGHIPAADFPFWAPKYYSYPLMLEIIPRLEIMAELQEKRQPRKSGAVKNNTDTKGTI